MRTLPSMVAALLIPAVGTSGCAGLDTSARAEGTGIQIVGAIVVLAKYQASQQQKAVAEARARQAFVERALRPAYEERARKLQAAAKSQPRTRPGRPAAATTPARPDPAEQARAELAALSASWKTAAARYAGTSDFASDFAVPGMGEPAATTAAVAFPKLSESDVLVASAAYVPRYLAVTVPSERSVPGARESVMLWDTRTHRLASDNVFVLDRTPPTAKPTKIEGMDVLFDAP